MERDRFWIIAGILFLIFVIFMAVIWIRSEYIFNNACQLCSKAMGTEVVCTTGAEFGKTISRTFYPNFTIVDGVS